MGGCTLVEGHGVYRHLVTGGGPSLEEQRDRTGHCVFRELQGQEALATHSTRGVHKSSKAASGSLVTPALKSSSHRKASVWHYAPPGGRPSLFEHASTLLKERTSFRSREVHYFGGSSA